jgi:diketogulonate reductase-like aldo/keto reductase
LNESKTHQPINNQIEINPYCNNDNLVKFCLKNNVSVTAYSPLGNPSAPPTRKWDEKHVPLIQDERLEPIAKKYNKSVAQE